MADNDFDRWWAAMRAEAARRDVSWIIGTSQEHYRPVFEAGRSPEDEIAETMEIAEWRGCGCGGGG